jgi:PAS domain S-box-containing protein
MTRLLGHTEDELTQMTAGHLTHPDDAAREQALLEELAAGTRGSYGIEKRNRHRDGHWIWVWVTVSLLDGGEPPRLALAHFLDITERKRSEEELRRTRINLERSNDELDQFAYVASHDLKEPLILLSAYARMLDDRHSDELSEQGRTFLGHVRSEAERMKSMIDDLLDYSRLETRAEDAVDVDLAESLETALRTIGPTLEEAGAEVDVEGPLPLLRGSPSQFERLFRNLISNAIKFHGDDPPRVRIRAQQDGEEWLFEVQDNGIGIDPSKADRIFDVFQRLHSQESYAGTGMGLAICKRVVERHGGRIWAEPGPEGGSIFRFALPE